jgi:hypothetical protein
MPENEISVLSAGVRNLVSIKPYVRPNIVARIMTWGVWGLLRGFAPRNDGMGVGSSSQ